MGSHNSRLLPLTRGSSRLWLLIGHPWAVWALLAGAWILVDSAVLDLSRYFLWDEAVFYSQSGGFGRADGPPLYYSPSREPGTPALIGLFRVLGASLVGVRGVWLIVTVGVGAVAFGLLEDRVGRLAAVLGFTVWVSSWLSIVHATTLFGVAPAAAFGLLAVALALVSAVRPTLASPIGAAILGVVVAGMLLLRPVEGAIVAIGVGVLVLVMIGRRSSSWSYLLLAGGVAGVIVALGFWLSAEHFFGSVPQWFSALEDQLSGQRVRRFRPVELAAQLLGGGSGSLAVTWGLAIPIVTGSALLLAVMAGAVGRRSGRDWATVSAGSMLVVCFGAFLFVFPFEGPGDKYLVWLPAWIGLTISGLWSGEWEGPAARRWAGLLLIAGALIIGGLVASNRYADFVLPRLQDQLYAATTVNVLAQSKPCRAITQHNLPQLQIGSGCRVDRAFDLESLKAWMREGSDEVRFAYWNIDPAQLGVDGWEGIRVSPDSAYYIMYEVSSPP